MHIDLLKPLTRLINSGTKFLEKLTELVGLACDNIRAKEGGKDEKGTN